MDTHGFSRFIIRGLSLYAAIMAATPALSQSPRGDSGLPVLYGVKFDAAQITIEVLSYADTFESDFSVQLDPEPPDSFRLSIVRRREDRGKVAPHIVTLTLAIPPVAKLEQARFLLMNKLASPGALARER